MNSNEITDLVIKRLKELECPPLAKVASITKENKAKSYKLLTENPKITLEEFLKEMNLEAE